MEFKSRVEKSFYHFACDVVRLLGIIIFFLLALASLISSQYMLPGAEELPINKMDIPIFSFVFPALAVVAAVLLSQVGKGNLSHYKTRILNLFLLATVAWIIGASMWWILGLNRVPEGDQAFVYGAASYFLRGDYSFLKPGGYCQIYPQQLGFIGVLELLFYIIGAFKYFAVEVINVLLNGGIVIVGYLIVRELDQTFEIGIIYLIFMWGCLPLIFYASWVYNDIPGIFFMMLSTMFFLRNMKSDAGRHLFFGILAGVVAVVLRSSNLIFLVALLVVAVVNLICRRGWKLFFAACLTVAACYLASMGISSYYEKVSGEEIGDGLPVNSWIAMGMQERRGASGWYNNVPKEVAAENDWDYDAVKEAMNGIINQRLEEFAANPGTALVFYAKKVLSQWNDPLFQSLYFSAKYKEEDAPAPGTFMHWIYDYNEGYFTIFEFANLWHFMVFFGVLLYFILVNKEGKHPLTMLPAVTILGGFFFSILWEAKGRYILPYFILMYPLSAWGYVTFARKTGKMEIWKKAARLRKGSMQGEEEEKSPVDTLAGPMSLADKIAGIKQPAEAEGKAEEKRRNEG